jgi:hypothetical protein
MSKQILDRELVDIVRRIVEDENSLDDDKTYRRFLLDLGSLLTNYCGGEVVDADECAEYVERDGAYIPADFAEEGATTFTAWSVGILATEDVPSDGGVWADYDTDVSVAEWFAESDIELEEEA